MPLTLTYPGEQGCPATPTGPSQLHAASRTRATARLVAAPAPLRLWHLASLDAPTVAVVWSLAFAWAAKVRLPLWVPVLLALLTWSVYIADRLLDARAGLRSSRLHQLRQRHIFHWRHRRLLVPLAVAAACAAAAIIFSLMPATLREHNSVLAAAALAYFSGVHSRRRPPAWLAPLLSKEFLVGVIFTAGCALPAWSRLRALPASGSPFWTVWLPAAYCAALAWFNCHAIGHWEQRPRGRNATGVLPLGCALGCAGLFLAVLTSTAQPRTAALLLAVSASALLLAWLDRLRNRISPLALRAAADLVLLTPLLLIPMARWLA